ncbi:MAG: hypothetical protein KUG77_24185, partial [Nannocystaceae bacterium]|nr:hypothetical protein [Nannocystaceae bacterium]
MQVYTKILIGMLVGAIVGLTLGPNSSLLEADLYKVTSWDRLDLQIDKDDPDTAFRLPAKPKNPSGQTSAPKALRLEILETQDAELTDKNGDSETLPGWSKVNLPITNQLLLRDKTGDVLEALGDPEVGDTVPLWV